MASLARAVRRILMVLGLVVSAACGGGPPGQPADAAIDGMTGARHGPKCSIELVFGPAVDCISAVIARHGDTTVLMFNLCWRNDLNVCDGSQLVTFDGVLSLPGPEWREGHFTTAGGFIELQLRGGGHYRLAAPPDSPDGAFPIDLRVTRTDVEGGGSTLRGALEVSLARMDAPGAPLVMRATIN